MTPPATQPSRSPSRRWLHLALAGVSILALYALVAGWVLPWLAPQFLRTRIAQATGLEVQLQRISFQPFSLHLTLHDFSLSESNREPFLQIPQLEANLEWRSTWKRQLHLHHLIVHSPRLQAVRDAQGHLDVLQLAHRLSPPSSTPTPIPSNPPPPFPLFLGQFQVTNASLSLLDHSLLQPFQIRVHPILVNLTGISTVPGPPAHFEFSAQTDNGATLAAHADLVVLPPQVSGAFTVSNLALAPFQPYAPAISSVLPTQGTLFAHLPFHTLSISNSLHASVQNAAIHLSHLELAESPSRQPLLQLADAHFLGLTATWPEAVASLSNTTIRDGTLHLRRFPSGSSNVDGLIQPEVIETLVRDLTDWLFTLDQFQIAAFEVRLNDQTLTPPADLAIQLESLELKGLTNRSNAPPASLSTRLTGPESGSLSLLGEGSLLPARARLKTSLSQWPVTPYQPYLDPFLRLDLRQGSLHAELDTSYASIHPNAPLLTTTGSAALRDFDARDSSQGTDFVRGSAIELHGLQANLEPNQLALERLAIRQLQTSLILTTNGQLNVLEILRQTEAQLQAIDNPTPPDADADADVDADADADAGTDADTDAVASTKAPSDNQENRSPPFWDQWPMSIGVIELDQVTFLAADRFVVGDFSTSIESLNGTISHLALPPTEPALIDLNARLDPRSTFSLKGSLLPDPDQFTVDLQLDTDNADLTQFTPYAIRFAGYPIDRGRLTSAVHYQIEDNQLKADNRLRIDQLTLGPRTDSPDALSLPLKLGISLLKDSQGVIELDVPLTGSLDDPQFSFWPIVGQAFRNILQRLVTAPFAMLGSLFKSDAPLDFVPFAAGSPQLDPATTNRLVTLAQALRSRPDLQLEIVPGFHTQLDRTALSLARLEERSQSSNPSPTPSTSPTPIPASDQPAGLPIAASTPNPPDRERLIREIYARDFGPVSAPAIATPSTSTTSTTSTNAPAALDPASVPAVTAPTPALDLPLELMIERLVALYPVPADDLIQLARNRAAAVQQWFSEQPDLDTNRIAVLEAPPSDFEPEEPGVGFRLQ